ncbi:hypothetical protein ACFL27_13785 [candidate division CSSED10-310 bacterium]|uniref:Glycosyltransferase RgtA/B/C/D-like domain-containing protein n=1 Tax=candidate division CSSED10-310 bacterium TaxID=2855610 RepID=A0ABV6YYK4_UNCC1
MNNSSGKKWILSSCLILVFAAALQSTNKQIGGGDTWIALACGQYHLNANPPAPAERTHQMQILDLLGIHISYEDPFGPQVSPVQSASFKERRWINQNWLSHIIFYKMAVLFGENSLVLLKFGMVLLISVILFRTATILGAHPVIAAPITAFGLLQARSFIDIRPHVLAAIMIALMFLLLAQSRAGKESRLFLMIPVMIFWPNLHGSFIYGVFIFILTGFTAIIMTSVAPRFPSIFRPYPSSLIKKYLLFLLLGLALPCLFSPYGIHNLSHPFSLVRGSEGEVYRSITEWKPLLSGSGFGNTRPALFFLSFTICVIIVRLGCLFSNRDDSEKSDDGEQFSERYGNVTIDPVHFLYFLLTMALVLKSRRFVFLSGIVLAPLVSMWLQDSLKMIGSFLSSHYVGFNRWRREQKSEITTFLGLNVLCAAIFFLILFGTSSYHLYFNPLITNPDLSVFAEMIKLDQQPRQAVDFLKKNKVRGLLFNEWTEGGFIIHKQDHNHADGSPYCRVFIDGRSQAAYPVQHLLNWERLRVPFPASKDFLRQEMFDFAHKYDIQPSDPAFYEKLIAIVDRSPKTFTQVNLYSQGDPKLFWKLNNYKLKKLLKKVGLDPNEPGSIKHLVDRCKRDQSLLLSLTPLFPGNPDLYAHVLEFWGISAVLIRTKHSVEVFSLLLASSDWQLFFLDGEHALFLSRLDQRNQALTKRNPEELYYPDDFSRIFCTGYRLCSSPRLDKQVAGLRKLLSLKHRYIPLLHTTILEIGLRLKLPETIIAYFSEQRLIYTARVKQKIPGSYIRDLSALASSCTALTLMMYRLNRHEEHAAFHQEAVHYGKVKKKYEQKKRGTIFW